MSYGEPLVNGECRLRVGQIHSNEVKAEEWRRIDTLDLEQKVVGFTIVHGLRKGRTGSCQPASFWAWTRKLLSEGGFSSAAAIAGSAGLPPERAPVARGPAGSVPRHLDTMKLTDLIRALFAALTTSVNTDANDQTALAAAQAQNSTLSSQLSAANAQIASDQILENNVGTPLTDDELAHINNLLSTVTATPPPATPVPAPPAPPTGDDTSSSSASAAPASSDTTGSSAAAAPASQD